MDLLKRSLSLVILLFMGITLFLCSNNIRENIKNGTTFTPVNLLSEPLGHVGQERCFET